MRTLLVAVLASVALFTTGCFLDPPDKSAEAQDLRSEVAALPGVEKVVLRYDKGVALDPADNDLHVRVADDATAEQVADVFAETYDGYLAEHAEEEGNLTVRWRDDTLELRSFQPEAATEDVRAAALAATDLVDRGRLLAQVTTQDVGRGPHVRTSLWVWLAAGSDPDVRRAAERAMKDAFDGLLLGIVETRVPASGRR
jgi:hypothetical protein